MGSWSVSCNISNIAITAGQECLLLPLRNNKNQYFSNSSYLPATLPIYGEYNNYGEIEDIIKNDNTKLIEEHFGVSIEDFCYLLCNGKYTYNRAEASLIYEKINKIENIGNMKFMWIDKQVYNELSKCIYKKGHYLTGSEEMLLAMGFVEDPNYQITKEDVADPERYYRTWVKDNKKIFSDDRWIQGENNRSFYYVASKRPFKGCTSNLPDYVNIDKKFIDISKYEAYLKYNKKYFKEFKGILCDDMSGFSNMDDYYKSLSNDEKEKLPDRIKDRLNKPKDLATKYWDNLNIFGNEIVKLLQCYVNLNYMSGEFRPNSLYLTPQCGAHSEHQYFLDKFSEINKSYIITDD